MIFFSIFVQWGLIFVQLDLIAWYFHNDFWYNCTIRFDTCTMRFDTCTIDSDILVQLDLIVWYLHNDFWYTFTMTWRGVIKTMYNWQGLKCFVPVKWLICVVSKLFNGLKHQKENANTIPSMRVIVTLLIQLPSYDDRI